VLEAVDHARVRRETMAARNDAARRRRAASRVGPRPELSLTLPGVVSWQRPREQPVAGGQGRPPGHRTAYPQAYVEARDGWRLVVRAAVAEASWARPPVSEALCVVAEVVAPGRMDMDRVLSAVLDALQAGEALKDDCRVWRLHASRRPPGPDEAPHVQVLLTTDEGG
jgi:hypothetical protein